MHGWVDQPADGAVEGDGIVEIAGWVAPAPAVDRVEVTVGDSEPERARLLCGWRPDLVDHLGDPAAAMAGFWHLVDTTLGPAGRAGDRVVRVEAVGASGRTLLGERRVTVAAEGPDTEPSDRRWVSALAARADASASCCRPGPGLGLVVFTHDLGWGGAQLWLREILDHLLAQPDVRATVVAPADGPQRAGLEAAGARVHLMGPLPTTAAAYEAKIRELALLVVEDRANVVLANTMAARLGVDVADRCGLASVWAVHDHYRPAAFWRCAFGRGVVEDHVRERGERAFTQASAVCFVSEATRALVAPDLEAERSLVVDYGIALGDLDRARLAVDRSRWRAEHGLADQDTVVLCTATVDARKSQAVLVAAFARIAGAHPSAQLVLVGAGEDDYVRGTRALARALGVGDRVHLVATTAEVIPWYVAADVFALASDGESLPRSLIEAMANGLALVATEVGGVGELVVPGKTGLLCPARDVAALARALDQLLAMSPAQRRELGERAQAAVWPARDLHAYVAGFARLLRGLAEDPTTSPRRLMGPAARPPEASPAARPPEASPAARPPAP